MVQKEKLAAVLIRRARDIEKGTVREKEIEEIEIVEIERKGTETDIAGGLGLNLPLKKKARQALIATRWFLRVTQSLKNPK